jgi:thiamine-phosphate pyrophosphorylase
MWEFDLCVITRQPERPDRSHADTALAALEGGVRCIQLRDRTLSDRALWQVGGRLRELTRRHDAVLIVNDRVDMAIALEADGVHLGQDDLPVQAARRAMGAEAIVGASVASPEEALSAEGSGATYVSVGSIFETPSKPDAGRAIGLAPIAQIKDAVTVPVLAIGGINCDNVGAVIGVGADGVAVISAVADAPDISAATRRLCALIREARGNLSA